MVLLSIPTVCPNVHAMIFYMTKFFKESFEPRQNTQKNFRILDLGSCDPGGIARPTGLQRDHLEVYLKQTLGSNMY